MTGSLYGRHSSAVAGGGKRAFVAGMARSVASGLYRNTFGYLFGGSGGDAPAQDTVTD